VFRAHNGTAPARRALAVANDPRVGGEKLARRVGPSAERTGRHAPVAAVGHRGWIAETPRRSVRARHRPRCAPGRLA